MKRTALRLVTLLAATVLSPGCASIFLSSHDELKVVTDPPGATARAGDVSVVTPGELKIPRRREPVVVRVEKEGYEPREVTVGWSRSGAVWTNVVGIGAGAVLGTISGLFLSLEGDDKARRAVTTGLVAGGAITATGLSIDLTSSRTISLDRDEIVLRLEPVRLAEAPKGELR